MTIKIVNKNKSDWRKIFIIHITNTSFIFRIYKVILQINMKKANNPIETWAKYMNRHFIIEGTEKRLEFKKMHNHFNNQRNTC